LSLRVRGDHLAFYVQRLAIEDKEKTGLLEKAKGTKASEREFVFDVIAKEFPDAKEYLQNAWTAYSRSSVFLWEVPAFKGFKAGDIRTMVAEASRRSKKHFRSSELGTDWLRLDAVQESTTRRARMLKTRVLPSGEIGATVRLTKTHHYVFEDEEKENSYQYDVVLSLMPNESHLVKVYGAQLDGKKTIMTFAEWLLGEPLPDRNPALFRYLKPVTFCETHVRALEKSLKMVQGGIEGEDARDKLGKVVYEGKDYGFQLEQLDLTDERVRDQEPAPQDVRKFNFKFTHPDGFVEATRVDFMGLKGTHPHLGFPVRSSTPAMDYLAVRLYASVGPGR